MNNASPFWTSTLQDIFIDIKNATSHGVLTPQNALWSSGSPFGTPTLTNSQRGSSLGSVRVHSLTLSRLFALPGACDVTPESTTRPTTLQPPPCLGRKPRLGLRQYESLKESSFPSLHFFFSLWFFFLCFVLFSSTWEEEDARRKCLKQKGKSGGQKWEGRAGAWK